MQNEFVPEILVALGSNVGDRVANMRAAADALTRIARITAASRIYETAPMYLEDQPSFLNAAVRGSTDLDPLRLLGHLKEIEATVGRHDRVRNGPREIDLDLIAYGSLRYDGLRLILPHPRLAERAFVLVPLMDIAPNWDLPGLGRVRDLPNATIPPSGDVLPIADALLSL